MEGEEGEIEEGKGHVALPTDPEAGSPDVHLDDDAEEDIVVHNLVPRGPDFERSSRGLDVRNRVTQTTRETVAALCNLRMIVKSDSRVDSRKRVCVQNRY